MPPPGILEDVSVVIKNIAQEMDNIGEAIQANGSYKKQYELDPFSGKIKRKN